LNRYSYVINNPLKYNDPSGHWAWAAIAALVGAYVNTMSYIGHNASNWTWGGVAKAATIGAVAGVVGVIAGPAGGTVAKALTGVTTGGIKVVTAASIDAAGGAVATGLGDIVEASVNHEGVTFSGSEILLNAAGSAAGGLVGGMVPTKGVNTLSQLDYLPRNVSNILDPGVNASSVYTSSMLSSTMGAVSQDIMGPVVQALAPTPSTPPPTNYRTGGHILWD
jgi:hypothetical protein